MMSVEMQEAPPELDAVDGTEDQWLDFFQRSQNREFVALHWKCVAP